MTKRQIDDRLESGYELFVRCPRCGHEKLRIWHRLCSRFVCSGEDVHAEYDGTCENPRCDFPSPRGYKKALAGAPKSEVAPGVSGSPIWDRGRFTTKELERVFSQPFSKLPPPFDAQVPCGTRSMDG